LNIEHFELQGYQQFVNPRFIGKKFRGTLLFIRNGIEAESYEKLNLISSQDACWCEVKMSKNETVLVGLVYRSPNSGNENNIKLNELMVAVGNENHVKKVVMGDFNYKDIDWNHWVSSAPETHVSHEFIESVRDSFLHQHINFHTRFRNSQQPSILDLVFSSDELLINELRHYSPIGKSDHVVISFIIDCCNQVNNVEKETFFVR